MLNVLALFILVVKLSSAQNPFPNYRITTAGLQEPYLSLTSDNSTANGNARYEGYVADLALHLANQLNFTYSLNIVADGKYGSKIPNTQVWDGMIGELLRNEADMIIAPLTITSERASVVAFSSPFMEFRLRILLKQETKDDDDENEDVEEEDEDEDEDDSPGPFTFLRPFSPFLWGVISVCLIIFVFLLYVIELYVPVYSDDPNHPTVIQSSPRFCQNGLCGSPRTASGRFLQIIIWIFITILVGAYISAFTADRIVDRRGIEEQENTEIESLDDLHDLPDIVYGVIRGGSTYEYFSKSWVPLHRKMFAQMIRKSGITSTLQEGFDRVRNGSYAFIVEGPYARYEKFKYPCDTIVAPVMFGPRKGFGVVTRNDQTSKTIREGVNTEILKMKETGQLEQLERKWFTPTEESHKDCPEMSIHYSKDDDDDDDDDDWDYLDDNDDDPLCLDRMAGLFYLLSGGIGIALIIAIIEIIMLKPRTEIRRDTPADVELRPHHKQRRTKPNTQDN